MSQGSVTEYSSDESLTSGAAADRRTSEIARTDVLNVDRVPSGELAKTLKCAPRIVISAISRLCTSGDNLEKLFRDDAASLELGTCLDDIILFFEKETDRLLCEYGLQDFADCVSYLFDADFLKTLLEIRKQLLRTASEDGPRSHENSVVCPVDRILSRFWGFVSSVARSGQGLKKQGEDELLIVPILKDEDDLCVASQLPSSWRQFPELLRSEHASPASKRLALCLLFASFVVKPDISNCNPWTSTRFDPGYIMECLHTLLQEYVVQARTVDVSESTYIPLPFRTAYAMAIALFSSAEAASQRYEVDHLAPFQPHTMACLLELMQYIFPQTSDASLVLDNLDTAQIITLHWGNTVAWAWEKWDDPRVIGFDAIMSMSANWVCYFDKSVFVTLWTNSYGCGVGDAPPLGLSQFLRAVLKINPRSSLIAFFHQICDENRRLTPNNTLDFMRLYRSAWCLAELLEDCADAPSSDDVSLVAERLIVLFAELGDNNSNAAAKVKLEVIRGLNALKREVAEKVLLSFQKNVSFFSKIAGGIAKASRMITEDNTGRFLLDPGTSGGLAALLNLISLFYKHDASRCVPVTAFQLLSDLVKFLSKHVGTLALRTALLNCLAHAYTQCQTIRSGHQSGKDSLSARPDSNEGSPVPTMRIHKTWEDEEAFCLALDMNCGDLGLAAAFASYVPLSIKKTMDPLLLAEAWDYLRDTLLLLANGRLENYRGQFSQPGGVESPEPDGPFTELTAKNGTTSITNATEKICTALETMLKRCDRAVVRLLFESPSTNSLYVSLESMAKAAEGGDLGGNASADGADGNRSTREEGSHKFDPRIVRTCEKFLEKLKKTEAELNK